MADTLQVVVRFLHILFGVAWVGGALFYGHAVAGGLRTAPPQVRGPAMLNVLGKAFTFYMIAGPATVLFGVWNQWLMAGELSYQGTTWNVTLGASLILSLAMLAIGFGFNRPTYKRLKALALTARGGPLPPEAATLQKRMMIGGLTVTALGVVAVLLMVVAVLTRSGVVA